MTEEKLDKSSERRAKFFSTMRQSLLWSGVFVGGLLSACFLFGLGVYVGSNMVDGSSVTETPPSSGEQDSSPDVDPTAVSEEQSQSNNTEMFASSVPSEYLQSLAASRRICFVMNNGANVSMAIKLNFDPMGIAAAGEMYEKNVPKPTQFSMDGLRVLGSMNEIKNTTTTSEEFQADYAKFLAVSFNKAYENCSDKFTEAEIKSMKDYFAKHGIQ